MLRRRRNDNKGLLFGLYVRRVVLNRALCEAARNWLTEGDKSVAVRWRLLTRNNAAPLNRGDRSC